MAMMQLSSKLACYMYFRLFNYEVNDLFSMVIFLFMITDVVTLRWVFVCVTQWQSQWEKKKACYNVSKNFHFHPGK